MPELPQATAFLIPSPTESDALLFTAQGIYASPRDPLQASAHLAGRQIVATHPRQPGQVLPAAPQIRQVRQVRYDLGPMLRILWLLLRTSLSFWFLSLGGSTRRMILLAIAHVLILLGQAGVLEPFRRIALRLEDHFHALMRQPRAGGNGLGNGEGEGGEHRPLGFLRRLERALVLFFTSIIPGFGQLGGIGEIGQVDRRRREAIDAAGNGIAENAGNERAGAEANGNERQGRPPPGELTQADRRRREAELDALVGQPADYSGEEEDDARDAGHERAEDQNGVERLGGLRSRFAKRNQTIRIQNENRFRNRNQNQNQAEAEAGGDAAAAIQGAEEAEAQPNQAAPAPAPAPGDVD